MDHEELLKKIGQIEEQARDALADYPNLTKERLRMILALARYIRSDLAGAPIMPADAIQGRNTDDEDSSPRMN